MKFKNKREYLDFYAEEMVRAAEKELKRWGIRTILPIPVNVKKRRERGFDQSVLLARKISRLTGIPVEEHAVIRSRYTLPQKELDARARKKNLKGAFSWKEGACLQEPVLLVDDIYTTGTTMDEVTRVLKQQGITKVYFLVLCAGKGK